MPAVDALKRSLLAIPANERGLSAEAADSDADEVVFDLEDSLAPGEKPAARAALVDAVRDHDWDGTRVSYRINGTDTRWWYDDVIEPVTAVGDVVDTLVVPKVHDPSDVRAVATLLDGVETNAGLDPGTVGLAAQIETAAGMSSAIDIAQASDRLVALVFGPADYAASVGAIKGTAEYPGHYWHYPLSRVAHAAAGAEVLAIGGPYTSANDPDGFEEACTHERALGYDGKMVIDAEQVATTNEVFAPTAAEARRARRIVREYRRSDPDEVAAIDGKVIDRETFRMADRILSKAEQADVI